MEPILEATISKLTTRSHTAGKMLALVGSTLGLGGASTADIADLLIQVPFPPRKDFPVKELRSAVLEEAVASMCAEMESDED
jgi:hypothetical protein